MHSPFTARAGRIHYAPHHTYRLPHLHEVGRTTLAHAGNGPTVPASRRDVPLYQLRWPGREGGNAPTADIPIDITNKWLDESVPTEATLARGWRYKLDVLVSEGKLPAHPPLCIAYHLAINSQLYYQSPEPAYPVAGLPTGTVAAILQTPFAIDGKHHAALTYLKWLAESHASHPLLSDFDSIIREDLLGIRIEAERCFFMLLQDCIYDDEEQWFARDERDGWQQLAHYLFLCGRAGDDAARVMAGLPGLIERWAKRDANVRNCSRFVGYPSAVLALLEQWRRSNRRLAERSSYTSAAWRDMPPEYRRTITEPDTETPNSDS